ncbi:hypothetical protein T492DRAFT_855093 [Pavlovales sp. CCMP2436]|nr:hypothetical protein T492DRAFT_855093 [Pavlovales sp. CCMP2436]
MGAVLLPQGSVGSSLGRLMSKWFWSFSGSARARHVEGHGEGWRLRGRHSGEPAQDTFGPSAEPHQLRLPLLQGASAYDAAHQDACTLALWTIDHGRRFCPLAAYVARQTRPRPVSADGRSQLMRIGSPTTSAARFSTQGVRAAGSMGAAVHSGTQQRARQLQQHLVGRGTFAQCD